MEIKKTTLEAKRNSNGGVSLWLFDLDNTLFDSTASVFPEIHKRMATFISERLHMDFEKAAALQHAYWREFGATFLGLERLHGIDPEEFFYKTHTFDLESVIRPIVSRARLRETLGHLRGRKVILTNGPYAYAERVIKFLQVEDCFEEIISPEVMRIPGAWRCKPQRDAIAFSLARSRGVAEETVLVDDGLSNLKSAKALGLKTVWCIGHKKRGFAGKPAYVDCIVRDVSELAKITLSRKPVKEEPRSHVENR